MNKIEVKTKIPRNTVCADCDEKILDGQDVKVFRVLPSAKYGIKREYECVFHTKCHDRICSMILDESIDEQQRKEHWEYFLYQFGVDLKNVKEKSNG